MSVQLIRTNNFIRKSILKEIQQETEAYFGLLDDIAVLSSPQTDAVWSNKYETVAAVDRP